MKVFFLGQGFLADTDNAVGTIVVNQFLIYMFILEFCCLLFCKLKALFINSKYGFSRIVLSSIS